MHDLNTAENEQALKIMIEQKLTFYTKRSLSHYDYAIEEAWSAANFTHKGRVGSGTVKLTVPGW